MIPPRDQNDPSTIEKRINEKNLKNISFYKEKKFLLNSMEKIINRELKTYSQGTDYLDENLQQMSDISG